MMGPSCGAYMYVQHERTPPIMAKYTRTERLGNRVRESLKRFAQSDDLAGRPGRIRTCDPGVMSPVLCH
ncbi:MAG: hypothetical protein QOF01_95 [Thermomicrobiales bacterium]|nr:hypothetical protein [Thermomicrobiales bacterium]